MLRFFSPPGNRAIFSIFWGDFLAKLHSIPGEKGNKSTGENSKTPVKTAPRNCRFLCLGLHWKIARFPGGGKSAESCHVSGCHDFAVPTSFSLEKIQKIQWRRLTEMLMVVSKRWFEFSGGTKFRYPFLPQFTSFLPQFYLFLTSF